ncbi:zinc ribbon domain-containing protein [Kitasatospora sp. NPDC056531]|uniref:zinc ribbon domain-containing protein n=1 Tax=Kitasatospora sp. NPDC056531 TaxID=3345856 RepID=UPI00367FBEBE
MVPYGRTVHVVHRAYPSSQLCSECGHRDGPKPLAVRAWACGTCGVLHDRDLNAARNILAAGQADRLNAPGGPASPGVAIPRQARPVERGTRLGDLRTTDTRAAGAGGIPWLQPGEDVKAIDVRIQPSQPGAASPVGPRGEAAAESSSHTVTDVASGSSPCRRVGSQGRAAPGRPAGGTAVAEPVSGLRRTPNPTRLEHICPASGRASLPAPSWSTGPDEHPTPHRQLLLTVPTCVSPCSWRLR